MFLLEGHFKKRKFQEKKKVSCKEKKLKKKIFCNFFKWNFQPKKKEKKLQRKRN